MSAPWRALEREKQRPLRCSHLMLKDIKAKMQAQYRIHYDRSLSLSLLLAFSKHIVEYRQILNKIQENPDGIKVFLKVMNLKNNRFCEIAFTRGDGFLLCIDVDFLLLTFCTNRVKKRSVVFW